jgi:hypothetical protein
MDTFIHAWGLTRNQLATNSFLADLEVEREERELADINLNNYVLDTSNILVDRIVFTSNELVGYLHDTSNILVDRIETTSNLLATHILNTGDTSKQYADDNFLPLTGGTLLGELTIDPALGLIERPPIMTTRFSSVTALVVEDGVEYRSRGTSGIPYHHSNVYDRDPTTFWQIGDYANGEYSGEINAGTEEDTFFTYFTSPTFSGTQRVDGYFIWLQVTPPKVFTAYSIASRIGFPNQAPKAWVLCGSMTGDDYDYVLLDDHRTDYVTDYQDGQPKQFTFQNDTAYNFYKLHFTKTNTHGTGGTDPILSISELRFYEVGATDATALTVHGGIVASNVEVIKNFSTSNLFGQIAEIESYLIIDNRNVMDTIDTTSNLLEGRIEVTSNILAGHIFNTSNTLAGSILSTSNTLATHIFNTSNTLAGSILSTSNTLATHIFNTSNTLATHIFNTSNTLAGNILSTSNTLATHIFNTSNTLAGSILSTSNILNDQFVGYSNQQISLGYVTNQKLKFPQGTIWTDNGQGKDYPDKVCVHIEEYVSPIASIPFIGQLFQPEHEIRFRMWNLAQPSGVLDTFYLKSSSAFFQNMLKTALIGLGVWGGILLAKRLQDLYGNVPDTGEYEPFGDDETFVESVSRSGDTVTFSRQNGNNQTINLGEHFGDVTYKVLGTDTWRQSFTTSTSTLEVKGIATNTYVPAVTFKEGYMQTGLLSVTDSVLTNSITIKRPDETIANSATFKENLIETGTVAVTSVQFPNCSLTNTTEKEIETTANKVRFKPQSLINADLLLTYNEINQRMELSHDIFVTGSTGNLNARLTALELEVSTLLARLTPPPNLSFLQWFDNFAGLRRQGQTGTNPLLQLRNNF